MGEEDYSQWVMIWITAIGVIATAVGVLITGYYSKRSFEKQRKQISAENVFRITDRLNTKHNTIIQGLLYEETLHGIFPNDENTENMVINYLNDVEMVSKFINEEVLQNDFAESQFGEILRMSWSSGSIRQIIDNERKNIPDFMSELDYCIVDKLKLATVKRN
jgi:hypothetical protein